MIGGSIGSKTPTANHSTPSATLLESMSLKNTKTYLYWGIFAIILSLSILLLLCAALITDFDSDELSSVIRAQNADNFLEHIQNGVLPDGHPTGIQTIIWLGTRFGGWSPILFRIIWVAFTIIGNLYFKKWLSQISEAAGYSETTSNWISLFGFAFISLMWWPVSMGFWLRPYAPGYSVFMVFLFHFEQLHFKKYAWIWTAVCLGILGYIHYFALLTALVYFIVSWGWEFKKIHLKTVLKIGVLSLFLNLPQLAIVFHQFQLGGLNWLGPPTPDFFFNHLNYISGNSRWFQGIIVVFISLGLLFQKRNWSNAFIKNWLVWVIVFIILYGYSIFRKPVLQHNALYFAFPLLVSVASELIITVIESFKFKIKNRILTKTAILSFTSVGFMALMVFNILFEKLQFADVRIHDRYAEPFRVYSNYHLVNTENSMLLVDGPLDVLNYHKNNLIHTENNSDTNIQFIQLIQNPPKKNQNVNQIWLDWANGLWGKDTLILALNAGSNMNILNILHYESQRCHLPWGRQSWVHRTVGGEIQCFGRNKTKNQDFNPKFNQRKTIIPKIWNEPVFIDLTSLQINKYDLIGVRFTSPTINTDSIKLVSALFKEGFNKAQIQYDYRWEPGNSNHEIYLTLKLIDIPEWTEKSTLRLSLESAAVMNLTTADLKYEVQIIPGNPFTYGI